MIPPLATARTTAREVQLRGVPGADPRSGRDVSTARASRDTVAAAAAGPAGAVRAPASTRAEDWLRTQAEGLRSVRARCCG